MLDINSVVKVLQHCTEAEEAFRKLHLAGFDVNKLSIIDGGRTGGRTRSTDFTPGGFMLVLEGTPNDVARAKNILSFVLPLGREDTANVMQVS